MLEGRIESIVYTHRISGTLKLVEYKENVNDWPSRCIVKKGDVMYSVSKWVSPKRTRSYPYSRVYDTFSFPGGKRVTIIPIVKDEGLRGDRDYLQWSTVALMSLLNVYVIIGYYEDGDPRGLKITNQRFNDSFIKEQFEKLEKYHSSSLHWNLDQLNSQNLKELLNKVIYSYDKINKEKGIIFHGNSGLLGFQQKLGNTVEEFKQFSSLKSQGGQHRETLTTHLLESLGDGEKMKIIIENYLGGLYYFTVDDVINNEGHFLLMECKHSNNGTLPSDDDVKDGLLKLILFTNLNKLFFEKGEVTFTPVLQLTSHKMIGSLTESSDKQEIDTFVKSNKLNNSKKLFLTELVNEVRDNRMKLIIKKV